VNNSDQFIIRESQKSEYREITDLSIKVWKTAYKGLIDDQILNNLSGEERLKGRIQWFTEPNKFSIIAMDKEKIIGFGDFGISRHLKYGKGEIYALYVLPEYQGHGAGKLLMQEAMCQLKQKSLTPYIVVTLETNLPAQKFYQSIGFKFIGNVFTCIGEKKYKENVYIID
jgi:ribosomal protein S18 acetylase RimI-like enzyme